MSGLIFQTNSGESILLPFGHSTRSYLGILKILELNSKPNCLIGNEKGKRWLLDYSCSAAQLTKVVWRQYLCSMLPRFIPTENLNAHARKLPRWIYLQASPKDKWPSSRLGASTMYAYESTQVPERCESRRKYYLYEKESQLIAWISFFFGGKSSSNLETPREMVTSNHSIHNSTSTETSLLRILERVSSWIDWKLTI